MYSYFDTYFGLRFAEHAATISGTANDFRKIDAGLAKGVLPDPQKDLSYMVKLEKIEQSDTEAEIYEVDGIIELFFKVVNKDVAAYSAIISNYITPFIRLVYATNQYSTTGITLEILKIGAENLNSINEAGLECQFTFKANVYY